MKSIGILARLTAAVAVLGAVLYGGALLAADGETLRAPRQAR